MSRERSRQAADEPRELLGQQRSFRLLGLINLASVGQEEG